MDYTCDRRAEGGNRGIFVLWEGDLVEIPSETPRNEADLAPATESLHEDEDGVKPLLVHAAVAAEDQPVEINPPPAIQQEIEVTFVRGLYPNLSGVPYMGHKWQ